MSYDIRLTDPATRETIQLDGPHQMRGGIYAAGGTTEAWLNVTYNYAVWYYKSGVFPDNGEGRSGIRAIYGLSGAESIPILQHAISAMEGLKEDREVSKRIRECMGQGAGGYWAPTRENALRPLHQLLALARMRPDGVWEGD